MTLAKQEMDPRSRDALLDSFVHGMTTTDIQRARVNKILGNVAAGTDEANAALIARDLHPEVIRHAQRLFIQGNYFHAVFEAAKAYNKQVRDKAQSVKNGEALMMEVWGWDKGVLKITPCISETDKNVQDGVKFLSAGVMRAIRNPTAHEPAVDWPINRADCLDILSFLSFLFRRLDESAYVQA